MKTTVFISTQFLLLLAVFTLINSCSKDESPELETVTDIDGNKYKVIKICDQYWLAENLRVTKYRNGDTIQYVHLDDWNFFVPGEVSYGIISDRDSIANIYGHIYNWVTINDSRGLAPVGWHIPTISEWQILIDCLGGEDLAGGKLKENSLNFWSQPNIGASDSSAFMALPGSVRFYPWIVYNEADAIGNLTSFWSSSLCTKEEDSGQSITITYFRSILEMGCHHVTDGLYVRCLKD